MKYQIVKLTKVDGVTHEEVIDIYGGEKKDGFIKIMKYIYRNNNNVDFMSREIT